MISVQTLDFELSVKQFIESDSKTVDAACGEIFLVAGKLSSSQKCSLISKCISHFVDCDSRLVFYNLIWFKNLFI